VSTPGLCRFCGAVLARSFIDLGMQPLANSFLAASDLARPEPRYPLHARLCEDCLLVQVDDAVPPEAIFSDYAYFSSYAAGWVEHARRYAEMAHRRFGLGPRSRVVEIASNDGYLLQHFTALGVLVLGVEPAANVAEAAIAKGIRTDIAFFGRATAERLAAAAESADLIVANNVLAHVPDINDFVAGLKRLLRPDGVITIEFPHLLRLIEQVQFDTIYHEHFSYFSLLAAERVLARHGLAVFDAAELPTHGGSLRLFVAHAERALAPEPGLVQVRGLEAAAGMDRAEAYAGFRPRVESARRGLLNFLDRAAAERRSVAAYGAAAKGNTMLNFCAVGPERVAYVVDRNPRKQGRFLPGSHIPIHAPEMVQRTRPDYLLILPWNLAGEISRQMAGIAQWGGRFATAIPSLRVFAPGEA
jgi:SAM-dependent methyltransferase